MKTKIKQYWRKFWFLLWKDDSPKGWIFSIVFLFIFIKFIFFPFLSLITGTSLPLAIVESCSMYHDGGTFPFTNYNTWWDNHETKYAQWNFSEEQFKKFVFNNGFNKGDILFIIGANPEKIKMGDIIIFSAGQTNPVIHRVIEIKETPEGRIFSTIGDDNNGQISFEQSITEEQLIGKAVIKLVPYAGWAKLIFFEHPRPTNQKGFCSEN